MIVRAGDFDFFFRLSLDRKDHGLLREPAHLPEDHGASRVCGRPDAELCPLTYLKRRVMTEKLTFVEG